MDTPKFSFGEDLGSKDLVAIKIDEGRFTGSVFVISEVSEQVEATIKIRILIDSGTIIDDLRQDVLESFSQVASFIFNDLIREAVEKSEKKETP
jgi:hypothetical protein